MYLTEAVIESAGGSCCRKLDCNLSPLFSDNIRSCPVSVMRKQFYSPGRICNLHPRDDPHQRNEWPKMNSTISPRDRYRKLLHACRSKEISTESRLHSLETTEKEGRTRRRKGKSRMESERHFPLSPQWKYHATCNLLLQRGLLQANTEELSLAFMQCAYICTHSPTCTLARTLAYKLQTALQPVRRNHCNCHNWSISLITGYLIILFWQRPSLPQ